MTWFPKYFSGLRGGRCDKCRAWWVHHREVAGLRFCPDDDASLTDTQGLAAAAKTPRADAQVHEAQSSPS
jgi:hypothetical protein